MNRFLKLFLLLLSDPKEFSLKIITKWITPTNWITKTLRRIYCLLVPNRFSLSEVNVDRLLFVYDTVSSPVTFDFLHYLYYAEWLRRCTGNKNIDLLLVSRPNLNASRGKEYISAIGDDNINWRIFNMLISLARLFPSVNRVYVVDATDAYEIVTKYKNIHPAGYGYASPKSAAVKLNESGFSNFPVLKIANTAKRVVEATFPQTDGRKIVTITLRSCDYIAVRNSNVASWVQFAKTIDSSKYRVIFIPDASVDGIDSFEHLDIFDRFDLASWNIEFRAALYQYAWINMGVVCGPLAISGLMDNVWTVMIDRSLEYPADYHDSCYKYSGVEPGKTPQFYSKSCHFYLGVDDLESLLRIFNKYEAEDMSPLDIG